MSVKTQTQVELETARVALKQAKELVTTLAKQRKEEVEKAKAARVAAKADREAQKAERQALKEKAKAERVARLQAAIAKLQQTEEKKKTNKAVARANRKPSKVTVTKFD